MSGPRPNLLIAMPPARSVLVVGDNLIRIESPRPLPNLWRRFWYRLLLGWRWEEMP